MSGTHIFMNLVTSDKFFARKKKKMKEFFHEIEEFFQNTIREFSHKMKEFFQQIQFFLQKIK